MDSNIDSTSTYNNPKAYPLADADLTARILLLCNQAQPYDQLVKGANECVKAINRGTARIVILAADADPLDIILHVPLLCEEKNVLYSFVPLKAALGRACGVERAVVAATIIHRQDSALDPQLNDIKNRIEHLFI